MVQNFKFSLALKARKTSSLHTTYFKTRQKPSTFLSFLVKGLDTLFFLQSILTLIVQTTVSAVLGAFSK